MYNVAEIKAKNILRQFYATFSKLTPGRKLAIAAVSWSERPRWQLKLAGAFCIRRPNRCDMQRRFVQRIHVSNGSGEWQMDHFTYWQLKLAARLLPSLPCMAHYLNRSTTAVSVTDRGFCLYKIQMNNCLNTRFKGITHYL